MWLDPTWRLLGNVNLPSLFTQEGYSILAARCHRKKMNLFYIRPKLHMLAHEGCLVHVRFALMTHGYLYVSMWLCKYYKVGVFWNSSHWLRLRIGRNAERGLQQINPLSHLSEIFLSGHRIAKKEHLHICRSIWDYACWADEDFIGRAAQIARNSGTHSLSTTLRCTQKMLGAYLIQLNMLNG